MTKYCRQLTLGWIAAVLTLDDSLIVITKIWFKDAILSKYSMASFLI